MKTKKYIFIVFASSILLSSLTLVGCGEKKEAVEEPTSTKVVKPADASQGQVQSVEPLNPKAGHKKP